MNKCGYLLKALFLLLFYFEPADAVLASESYFKACTDMERLVQSIFRSAQHLYNSDSPMYSTPHAKALNGSLSGFWLVPFFAINPVDSPKRTYPALAEIHQVHNKLLLVYETDGLDASKTYFLAELAPFRDKRLSRGLKELNCYKKPPAVANPQTGLVASISRSLAEVFSGTRGTSGGQPRTTGKAAIWGVSPVAFLTTLFVALLVVMFLVDKLENRTARRYDVSFPTQITALHGEYDGTIVNISASGAKLVSDKEFEVGEQVFINVNSVATPAKVRWNKRRITGVQFSQDITKSAIRTIRRASRIKPG